MLALAPPIAYDGCMTGPIRSRSALLAELRARGIER
jgi:hypothetical protein